MRKKNCLKIDCCIPIILHFHPSKGRANFLQVRSFLHDPALHIIITKQKLLLFLENSLLRKIVGTTRYNSKQLVKKIYEELGDLTNQPLRKSKVFLSGQSRSLQQVRFGMTGKRRDSLYIESINTLLVDFSPKIDRYTDNIIQDRSDHVERW